MLSDKERDMFRTFVDALLGGSQPEENKPFKFDPQPSATKGGSYVTDEMYQVVVEITKGVEKLVELHNNCVTELSDQGNKPVTDEDYCKTFQFMMFSDVLNSEVIPEVDLLLSIHTLDIDLLKKLAQKDEKPFREYLEGKVKELQFKRLLNSLDN